jgi:signal transduction histidine kinase
VTPPPTPERAAVGGARFVAVIDESPRSVSLLCGRAALGVGLVCALLVVLHPAARGAATAAGVAVGATAAGWLLLWRPGLLPLPLMDTMLALADGLLVVLFRIVPGIRPAFPCIFLMIGCVLFALRGWRPIVVHLTLIGASVAAVMGVLPPQVAPASRWCGVMILILTLGLFIRWLVNRALSLARSEHVARTAAEFATAELAEESAAKSRFLARMSHELRTPLNVVLGFADLLSDPLSDPLNERQTGYVADISNSARHLVTLVDDVLDLANVEAGQPRLMPTIVDLREVVAECYAMLRDRAEAAGLRLDVDLDPSGAGWYALADRVKIRQVLVNLIANSLRFTPAGGRVIIRGGHRGKRAWIAVEDNGIGVAESDREHIFAEYAQSAGTADGTGLGLALSRRLIELHGGSLWLRPRPDGGSIFEFEVPVDSGPQLQPADATLRVFEYDAILAEIITPMSPENCTFIAGISMRLWAAGGLIATLLGAITPWPWPGRIASMTFGLLAIGIATPLARVHFRVRPIQIEIGAYCSILSVSLLTYYVSDFSDTIPLGYAWITMISFSVWPLRRAVLHMVAIGISYAALIAAMHEPNPIGHWLTLMVLLTFNAEIVRWISARLREAIGAEREAHRATRVVAAELTTTSRHKSRFVANMSHELRTPLNAIVGFAELLGSEVSGTLTPSQRDFVTDIDASARHLLAIVNDVLDTARMQSGQLVLRVDDFSVADLLRRSIRLADATSTHLRSVRVNADPELTVSADAERLEQVVVQLVTNAAKFTPPGGEVEVSAARMNGELRITVSDSGIGISDDQVGRVFDAFHQGARVPPQHASSGTGLGLSLARGIVELHGGRIWVTSEPDCGSTFTVALPVRLPDPVLR